MCKNPDEQDFELYRQQVAHDKHVRDLAESDAFTQLQYEDYLEDTSKKGE